MTNTDNKGVVLRLCPASRRMLEAMVRAGEYPSMAAAANAAVRQHYEALTGVTA